MSADNAIVILELEDMFIVEHCQALDNLYWECMESKPYLIAQRVFEYFNEGSVFDTYEEALVHAANLFDALEIVEYGIQKLQLDLTWLQLVLEARNNLIEEIAFFVNGYTGNAREDFIEQLRESYRLAEKEHNELTKFTV
ncbi:MAG: hypothetical protein WA061_02490 [Microgenomates group bacterium]